MALDPDEREQVRRESKRLHDRIKRGGRRRVKAGRRGRPGERFYGSDDVDLARVHAAEKRVGDELEKRRQERIAARGGR